MRIHTSRNHYEWLEKNLESFWIKATGESYKVKVPGIISCSADKAGQYEMIWEMAGIPFEHGAAMYLLTYAPPFSNEVRNTPEGWVHPREWVVNNYKRFKECFE